jgi:hypothetical protein
MRAVRLVACFVPLACLLPGAAETSEITALPPLRGLGLERGIAVVSCAMPGGVFWVSQSAILDVGGAANADVLLTTAHGLPADSRSVKRDCRVLVRGKRQVIAEVWHAGGDRGGPEHDWAVLLTQHVSGAVHRWRPAQAPGEWLTGAVDRAAPVRLVRRYADESQSDCRLEAKTADPRLLLAYSCITYPGQSGLPLVIALDREPEPVLIGVNIGRQSSWAGTKLDFTSVARPLDAEISATIERAAARAAQTVWRRRGSPRVTRRDDG